MKQISYQKLAIQKYKPEYKKIFSDEKQEIQEKLGKYIFGVEHVGSTSVSGLDGKPVIDILIGINEEGSADTCIKLLTELGYHFVGYTPGQQWYLRKHTSDTEGFHVHMIEKGNKFWNERIAFRDYLQAHPKEVNEYKILKKDLFKKFGDNRIAYREGKDDFMNEITKKALKINSTLNAIHYTLTIGWLYPDLMSTYGDRGNIIVLQKRCQWRGINVEILPINQSTKDQRLKTIDLLFGGGAQDREQDIVMNDLKGKKGAIIKALVEKNIPALFVCGSPQLMGKYYEPAEGKRIEGLGIFNMVSKNPGKNAKRLIGNTVAKVLWQNFSSVIARSETTKQSHHIKEIATDSSNPRNDIIVGFENHGGRTYLGEHAKPFAKVIKGYGNNGEDGTEGVVYKNAIGCYFHGPLLPKNPEIADWLIKTALEVKYKREIILDPLDDSLEKQAKQVIAHKLSVAV